MQAPFISVRNEDAARGEMETNYFGTLEVARRFAPVLAANGGGALVNMRTPTTSGIVKLFEPPVSLRVTPRRRENGVGLPADADVFLGA